jgi:dinuclear metal center YbgI/SA1388 family protein
MNIRELISAFDDYASFSLQESYDNSGIQIGEPEMEVRRGLICLDVTEEILNEAIEKQCDVIISHHPLIFSGIKQLCGNTYVERIVVKAIRCNMAIISVHTNLDFVFNGVNHKIAQKLGLLDLQILAQRKGNFRKLVTFCPEAQSPQVREAIFKAGAGHIGEYDCCSFNIKGTGTFRAGDKANPFVGDKGAIHSENEVRIEAILPAYLVGKVVGAMVDAHPYEEVAYDIYPIENGFANIGMGMVGRLSDSIPEKQFLQLLRDTFQIRSIRHSGFTGKEISIVALSGGSGSSLLPNAIASGADAFITADIKYHDFFNVTNKLLLADVGHYESEQFTKELLHEILTKKFTNFALLISDLNTNPVRYF